MVVEAAVGVLLVLLLAAAELVLHPQPVVAVVALFAVVMAAAAAAKASHRGSEFARNHRQATVPNHWQHQMVLRLYQPHQRRRTHVQKLARALRTRPLPLRWAQMMMPRLKQG